MSTTVALPPTLRTRLAAIARRVRLLRAVRGLSLLVVVLGATGGAAVLADHWLDLPALVRQILFAAWLAEGAGLLLLAVVLPLCRRLEAAALAAVIEEKYPELGERLTSTVELSGAPAEGHGSPILIALLMSETETRTRPLDFRPAVPARCSGILAGLAAMVVLLALAPAFVWPQRVHDLTQRFFLPWRVPAVVSPYTLEVSPGDVIAARSRPVNLAVRLVPREDRGALPDAAVLVIEANGKETQQAMEADGPGAFKVAWKVAGDARYRIEAGGAVSDSFQVTAVTPVELATDSPTLTVTPPAYARATMDAETFHGLADLSALQHSQVRFDFRFTRPAVAARLEWLRTEVKAGANDTRTETHCVRHPLTLTDDALSATLTLPAAATGSYRVVLEAEHGILTEHEGGTLTVKPDQPPAVLKFGGKEDLRAVLPYERLPLELKVADDIAVAGVELEYRINDGEPVLVSLSTEGAGTRSAVARHVFELAGKVKEDDRVHYRFRVSDNLPKEYKGPHVIFYPADRWLTLQVARRGDPLKQKEILAQRDEINRRLEEIKAGLLQERRGVYKVRQESRARMTLPPDQSEQLRQLRGDNQTSQKALQEVAQTASATPALQPIAERARDVADREMQQSKQALDRAANTPKSPTERTRQFDRADEQLASAVRRLDELKKANDKLARERLDQARLEMLADREKQLAELAAELAAKHPVLDPDAKQQGEKIQREQAEVAAELERLAQQSETLRQALEQARAEQARQMAERARELAQAQRDLAQASAETERKRNAERLAELARKQQELAEQAARFDRETRQPAQAAKANPLKPEEAQQAAESLKQGDPQEAVRHQDQAANDLDRLANEFERAVRLSQDPREAARQLARAEEGLRKRVQEEMDRKNADRPLVERLKPLREQQEGIRRATERLSVPPSNPDPQKVKRQIAERAAAAERSLDKQDGRQAQAHMEQTRHALNRLADLLPRVEQRRQDAQREVGRLRREQDEIARQTEQIKKDAPDAERRLADAARRQGEVAEALGKMDAPNQEARQERTQEALNRALADLMDGRRQDVPATQQEARRQLERLEQALRGQKPADEQARDLARQQHELARDAARAAAEPQTTPQQKQDLQRRQQQIANQAQALQAPEAPQRQREAVEAARRAEQAARTAPTAPQTQQRMAEAARKLDELARQMAGLESDADRAERLAKQEAEAAAQAEREVRNHPGQAPTPEAQRRQQEIGQEARQVRGGEEARQEKQQAMEALTRAEQANPQQKPAAQRQAADALRDLADRLAGRNDPAAKANELAREQREMARAAAKAGPGKTAREEARQAADRQAELARQMGRINPKDAPEAAKAATEKMRQAAKALEQAKSPAEAKESLARAAEAAEKLAAKLGEAQANRPANPQPSRTTSAKPAEQSPRKAAEQLARQQRDLARATQQAQQSGKGGQASKEAMQQIARKQQALNQQASQLPANQAQKRLEQARAAMNRAQQALERNDAAQARQMQTEAANALDRLAQKLPVATSGPLVDSAQPTSGPLVATKEQSEEARRLARQQRELRDAVQRSTEAARAQRPQVQDNPVGELARQQAEVARQAADLARNVGQEQGQQSPTSRQAQQAAQAAQQANRQMQAGALPQARQAGQQTAEQLRQLAGQLARDLGRRQEEINRRLEPLAGDSRAQAAQQQNQQQNLQQQTGELTRDFNRMAQQSRNSPQSQSGLQQAANSGQQAQQAMQQARGQAQQGNQGQAQQSRQQAAQALDRAAQQASQGARQQPSSPKDGSQPGQSVQQAQQQMANAQGQLGQGKPGQAQASMQQAAQALKQAAAQMAQQQPGQPGQANQPQGLGRAGGGSPDLSAFGLDKTPYAGKSWGELPGELRTKIVQDMKARYGEDYARMIKLYFEQIAATNPAARPPAPRGTQPPAK